MDMDATQIEKIYVAVGYDVLDGFQTLDWALKKWNSHTNISIIILYVKYSIRSYLKEIFWSTKINIFSLNFELSTSIFVDLNVSYKQTRRSNILQ
jgi:hypothetical protein